MNKLLIVADDFTGALDTGVQFAARGAITQVITNPNYDFTAADQNLQVLVMMLESRHVSSEKAYAMLFRTVRAAREAGFTYIYKKTDSALRGNIGSELTAVMNAAELNCLPFLPAFPKMNRVTRNGIHYIDGVPVSESVFGRDPFEPVRHSSVADIIHEQSDIPVILHKLREVGGTPSDIPGIHVYDADSDEDLLDIAQRLGTDGLYVSAGCAGFARALADVLGLNGSPPTFPEFVPALFIVCGSVNPVTLRQMDMAEQHGFVRVHLTPEQKLNPDWPESEDGVKNINTWLSLARQTGRFILDVNDPEDSDATAHYAAKQNLTTEDLRSRVSENLAALMKRLLDRNLNATLLCTGGDTLFAMMRRLGVQTLQPVCEAATGAVLTHFSYGGKRYHIISKSGGFGEAELFCELASLIGVGNHKNHKEVVV